MQSDASKYSQFTNLFCNLKSSSGGRERQKQWLDALGNPACEYCAQDPSKRICDVERVACKACKDRHRSCPRFIKFMLETVTGDLGISNETYERYRVNFTRKGGGGAGASTRKSSSRKVREKKAKDRERRSARSASMAAAKDKKNGQPVAGTSASASASAGPLHVPGFESDLESLSDLDGDEDDHPSSNSAALASKNTSIPSASASTSRVPNLRLPPSRTSSNLTLEGWSQLCLSMSASLDNASRTKNAAPPTASGTIVTRNRSGTAHATKELAGPGVKRSSGSFLPPPPPRTAGSTSVNGAMSPAELKRRVQELEATLKERDRALKKQHEDRVRGDARARLLEGQLRDSDKRLQDCTARLKEGGSQPEVRELEETLQERDTLLKEREARVQELNELLKERDTRLEELESRVEGLHTRLQDPAKGGGIEELTTRLRERDARVEELEARLEQRRDSRSAEERDKRLQELSARVKERELRLKERDARILEQDVQIQDLTNRLSRQTARRSATGDLQEQENHLLDARRVEDLERRLRIQEQLRIQEERMRIEEGRLYRLRVDELEGMVRKRGEGTLMSEVGVQAQDDVDDSQSQPQPQQPQEELDEREKDIDSREQECAQRELEVRDREKGVKERERGVKDRERDMREKEREFREREKETREKERERREREKGVGRLDMARYTPVALDEDGERELRELKDEMDVLKSSRFRQTILTHGVQVLLLKLLSDLETNSSDMGRNRVQRRLSEIQKQLGSVMIAGVETDMERSEYMERLDAVAVVGGGTVRGESASTAGGGKRKRRAAEGETEGEEGRRSGKKAKGGQSSSSSLNLPFGV